MPPADQESWTVVLLTNEYILSVQWVRERTAQEAISKAKRRMVAADELEEDEDPLFTAVFRGRLRPQAFDDPPDANEDSLPLKAWTVIILDPDEDEGDYVAIERVQARSAGDAAYRARKQAAEEYNWDRDSIPPELAGEAIVVFAGERRPVV